MAGKKSFTGGINTKSQTVAGATVLGNDILGGVVRVSGGGNINLLTPVDNAGGRISFYFEADCSLNTPSGSFIGTIGQAVKGKILCLLRLGDISNVILTEQTGLLCEVQTTFRR